MISPGKTAFCLQRVETRRRRDHARAPCPRSPAPAPGCGCRDSTYLALVQQLRVLRSLRLQFHGHLLAVIDVHGQVDIAERAAADLTYEAVLRRGADVELRLRRRRRRLRPLGLLGHRCSRPPRRRPHLTSPHARDHIVFASAGRGLSGRGRGSGQTGGEGRERKGNDGRCNTYVVTCN